MDPEIHSPNQITAVGNVHPTRLGQSRTAHPQSPIRNPKSKIAPITLILLLTCVTNLYAAGSPRINSLLPRGGQRGTEIVVTFAGARLDVAQGVLFDEPGILMTKLEQVDANRVRCHLKIAADCRIGLRPLRLRTTQGISNIKLFSIGTLPEFTETEPNNVRAKPQRVTLPATIHGTITNEDVDCFAFVAKKGETLSFEVEGIRLGDTLFDPFMAIYDSNNRPIATADDTCLTRQDPTLTVTIPADGNYQVEIRETAYGGSGSCHYRLHVGAFPRPVASLPCGGQLGSELELEWIGDPSITKQIVKLPGKSTPGFNILPAIENRFAPSPVPFHLSPFPTAVEIEPNNDDNRATPMIVPGGMSGAIDGDRDVDCFVFDGKKGQKWEASVYARRLRSPLDPVIAVRKRKGPQAGGNDDAVGPDCMLRFTCAEDGKKIVAVRDLLYKSGPNFTYFLEIAPIRPKLWLTMLPEPAGVAVAPGNRSAILLTAHRQDFGGKLTVASEGLPTGVTLQCDTMHETISQIPVVFEAAADAPKAGATVDLVARPVDSNLAITGRLRQRIDQVKFMNAPMYSYQASHLALAVTEAAGFSIAVVEPKAPIVRLGTMALPVKLTRTGDFKGDVTIRLLWNPPGIGSGSLILKGDQTEGVIHLNARGDARLGPWKTTAVATSRIGGGDFQVASSLFTLQVAEPMVDFQIVRARTELGKPVELSVKVVQKTPIEGEAQVELLGLPPRVTTVVAMLGPGTKSLKFPLSVDAKAPAGRYGGLFVRSVVTKNGQPVVHHSPRGELILDRPLPPKDPAKEAARAEAKRKAAEARAKKKADRLAAAKKRRAERAARRQKEKSPSGANP